MDTVTIIGIKVTVSTKNPQVTYYNYYYTSLYSDYDMKHALEISGKPCGIEFSTVDIGCKVGDEVEFKYTKGFQDKATLVGCTVINPAPVNIGKK
jgi:hypothetical protein